jgi:hypothetical protein
VTEPSTLAINAKLASWAVFKSLDLRLLNLTSALKADAALRGLPRSLSLDDEGRQASQNRETAGDEQFSQGLEVEKEDGCKCGERGAGLQRQYVQRLSRTLP